MKRVVILIVLACGLSGCNWALFQFRAQLKDLADNSRWEDLPWGRALIFREPILTSADLKEAGVAPVPVGTDLFAIHYTYRTDRAGGNGETTMTLLIEQDRLRGVAFPPLMIDMLGQRNVEALLRMTGGAAGPGSGVRDVEKARVLRALFGADAAATNHRKLVVTFEPREAGNRMLTLTFEEGKRAGIYSSLRLVVGKPGETVLKDGL